MRAAEAQHEEPCKIATRMPKMTHEQRFKRAQPLVLLLRLERLHFVEQVRVAAHGSLTKNHQ